MPAQKPDSATPSPWFMAAIELQDSDNAGWRLFSRAVANGMVDPNETHGGVPLLSALMIDRGGIRGTRPGGWCAGCGESETVEGVVLDILQAGGDGAALVDGLVAGDWTPGRTWKSMLQRWQSAASRLGIRHSTALDGTLRRADAAPLVAAFMAGSDAAVEHILVAHPEINRDGLVMKDGTPWLHAAVACGYLQMAEALVRCGIDPNLRDAHGRTALFMATGHMQVQSLLALGMRGDCVDATGRDAAMFWKASARITGKEAEAMALAIGGGKRAGDIVGGLMECRLDPVAASRRLRPGGPSAREWMFWGATLQLFSGTPVGVRKSFGERALRGQVRLGDWSKDECDAALLFRVAAVGRCLQNKYDKWRESGAGGGLESVLGDKAEAIRQCWPVEAVFDPGRGAPIQSLAGVDIDPARIEQAMARMREQVLAYTPSLASAYGQLVRGLGTCYLVCRNGAEILDGRLDNAALLDAVDQALNWRPGGAGEALARATQACIAGLSPAGLGKIWGRHLAGLAGNLSAFNNRSSESHLLCEAVTAGLRHLDPAGRKEMVSVARALVEDTIARPEVAAAWENGWLGRKTVPGMDDLMALPGHADIACLLQALDNSDHLGSAARQRGRRLA